MIFPLVVISACMAAAVAALGHPHDGDPPSVLRGDGSAFDDSLDEPENYGWAHGEEDRDEDEDEMTHLVARTIHNFGEEEDWDHIELCGYEGKDYPGYYKYYGHEGADEAADDYEDEKAEDEDDSPGSLKRDPGYDREDSEEPEDRKNEDAETLRTCWTLEVNDESSMLEPLRAGAAFNMEYLEEPEDKHKDEEKYDDGAMQESSSADFAKTAIPAAKVIPDTPPPVPSPLPQAISMVSSPVGAMLGDRPVTKSREREGSWVQDLNSAARPS